MLMLVLPLALLGAVLGMRYTVLSLVPITLMVWTGLAGVTLTVGESAHSLVVDGVVAAVALQFGYLAAMVGRHMLLVARARAMKAGKSEEEMPAVNARAMAPDAPRKDIGPPSQPIVLI